MKEYKFEIVFTEEDIAFDEFWEQCLQEDSTGIKGLTEEFQDIVEGSNIFNGNKSIKDIVKLVSYVHK